MIFVDTCGAFFLTHAQRITYSKILVVTLWICSFDVLCLLVVCGIPRSCAFESVLTSRISLTHSEAIMRHTEGTQALRRLEKGIGRGPEWFTEGTGAFEKMGVRATPRQRTWILHGMLTESLA